MSLFTGRDTLRYRSRSPGILDRPIASAKDYNYSRALKSFFGRWTAEKLDTFLQNPDKFAPGTSMRIPPIQNPKVRASLIEYLKSQKGT